MSLRERRCWSLTDKTEPLGADTVKTLPGPAFGGTVTTIVCFWEAAARLDPALSVMGLTTAT
jgi:hypothetical protein